ncbi:unnamed protein product [Orchesella dallaii]|uniref:Nbr1 FW domain-containing protein n=1 Tax=Orchesella dallaii TaxID=48710 RepID=A0ABP1S3N2_9HEXA
MEMEDDMEVGLVQQFSCLGTTDKEVLVAQLQKLVGPQLNTSAAHFFLDMNNWNLQLAIGAYFDLTEESPPSTQYNSTPQMNGAASQNDDECWEPEPQLQQQSSCMSTGEESSSGMMRTMAYSMSIIQDMSLTEETILPPRTKFLKQWKVRNSGNSEWPNGTHLRIVSGNRSMLAQEKIFINPQVQSGECREVSAEFLSPDSPGSYQICWQMSTPEGYLFGDEIWMIVTVGPDMTVDLTERLQSLTCDNNRVNFPVVQLMSLPNGCPPTNAQVPTAAVGGGDVMFSNSSQDPGADMS